MPEFLQGMSPSVGYAALGVVLLILLLSFVAIVVAKFYRKVDQGHALIVNTMRSEPTVTFTGAVVFPIVHRAEVMDISVKTIEIDRRGKEGLICMDNIRADIKVTFFVRVNKTSEDVLKVAQSIGCVRASDHETLEQLFVAKFSEALKTVGKRLEFEQLYTMRDDFRDQIIGVIGKDLNGYVLDDAAIDYLEQTPLDALDPSNILDAQGIRKITQMTAEQNVRTNELKQEERKAITRQNVDAAEAILQMEKEKADAEMRQRREILTIKAREDAEISRVQSEEKQKSELARIKEQEEVAISEENKTRQVQVAQKNRERVVAVEAERVEKDRALEQIARERETELQRIEKEKALEHEKKAIADVVAARIAVEKHVAEEEERIKDLRLIADAKRHKEVHVVKAEAAAEANMIGKVKEAQAGEEMAKHKAKEKLIHADADLEAADRVARGKLRIAEGTQAEEAATGLARAKVKEADAIATEKLGMVEARVKFEQMQSEARGREATAEAVRKMGEAEADAKRQMLTAEAQGHEQQGLADVKVREADAGAIEKRGIAEAVSIKERFAAEALGLLEKANALSKLGGEARQHEEFRMGLEKRTEVALAELRSRVEIALRQSEVMAKAMQAARINLVGGDGAFLDKFFKAVSLGHALDGAIEQSDTVRQLTSEYMDGKASLREDVKQIISQTDSESIKNISVVAALTKLMSGMDGPKQKLVNGLVEKARELGLE